MKKISPVLLFVFLVLFLSQIAYADEVDSLIQSLGDENERVREVAERKLVRIGEPAEKALIKALGSSNPLVRRHAGYALAQMGNPKAIESLVVTMTTSGEKHEIEKAAKYLAKIGCEEAVPVLIDMLKNDNNEIQKQGKEGLIRIGKPAFEPVLKLLKHKDLTTRIAVIDVLGAMRDRRGVEFLIETMREDTATRIY